MQNHSCKLPTYILDSFTPCPLLEPVPPLPLPQPHTQTSNPRSTNEGGQAGAELCRAQAQMGWYAEATTKQNLHLNVCQLF